jgi:hypothetical protein
MRYQKRFELLKLTPAPATTKEYTPHSTSVSLAHVKTWCGYVNHAGMLSDLQIRPTSVAGLGEQDTLHVVASEPDWVKAMRVWNAVECRNVSRRAWSKRT